MWCIPSIALAAVRSTYDPMPYHRFKVRQIVVALFGGPHALIPRGPHVIVRLLPLVGREPQYKIRSDADGLERVVLESQIRPAKVKASLRTDGPHPIKPSRRRK
jgi:hypothetical protein